MGLFHWHKHHKQPNKILRLETSIDSPIIMRLNSSPDDVMGIPEMSGTIRFTDKIVMGKATGSFQKVF